MFYLSDSVGVLECWTGPDGEADPSVCWLGLELRSVTQRERSSVPRFSFSNAIRRLVRNTTFTTRALQCTRAPSNVRGDDHGSLLLLRHLSPRRTAQ